MVVLTTGHTTTTGVLAVLADTALAVRDVAATEHNIVSDDDLLLNWWFPMSSTVAF